MLVNMNSITNDIKEKSFLFTYEVSVKLTTISPKVLFAKHRKQKSTMPH